jgi:hypothetical protein
MNTRIVWQAFMRIFFGLETSDRGFDGWFPVERQSGAGCLKKPRHVKQFMRFEKTLPSW